MCAGALVLSRIARVVYGAPDLKTGALGSRVNINNLKLNHKFKVTKKVLEDDCADILKQFFKNKRKKGGGGE